MNDETYSEEDRFLPYILERMYKDEQDGSWHCTECNFSRSNKHHLIEHVDAKHVIHPPYSCPLCAKQIATRSSLRRHVKKCELLARQQEHQHRARYQQQHVEESQVVGGEGGGGQLVGKFESGVEEYGGQD